jgi:hypothetical protein
VAGATGEHGIDPPGRGNQLGVLRVSEAEIVGPRPIRCGPLHSALDGTVVTFLAIARSRPKGPAGIGCARMAPDAAGKDRSVLPVVEAVLSHRATHAPRC